MTTEFTGQARAIERHSDTAEMTIPPAALAALRAREAAWAAETDAEEAADADLLEEEIAPQAVEPQQVDHAPKPSLGARLFWALGFDKLGGVDKVEMARIAVTAALTGIGTLTVLAGVVHGLHELGVVGSALMLSGATIGGIVMRAAAWVREPEPTA